MGRSTRRRPKGAQRATTAAIALILGGGGLVAANVYASATEVGSSDRNGGNQVLSGAATIDCPDVGSQLTGVPDQAKADVDKELALLDQQIAEAYQRLQNSVQAVRQDPGFADNAIMNPLKEKRAATIDRIGIAVDRVGDRPQGLEALAPCTLRDSGNEDGDGQNGDGQDGGGQNGDGQDGDQNGDGQNGGGDNSASPSPSQSQGQNGGQGQDQGQGDGQGQGSQQGGNGGQAGNGPVAGDYVDITSVQPNAQNAAPQGGASRGSFTTSCGVNANGLYNSDNVIVAPGVTNGAHHFHDYVGNQANNAFASDQDLANAGTSCVNPGDKSSYFWPVLRLQNGTQEQDANSPGGGIEGNAGEIVTPKAATMTFVGNPRGKVTAMPKLLRIITGDAKAFVNGTANANASWSCTGFEDRQLKDKYPLCPQGSDVVRTFKFQSCWDGRNIDSANHRTHVAFADAAGTCKEGFQAIPQLVQRIVYDVDAPSLDDGGRTTPLFAVDSFPEQLHKPVTDHGDFINVFDEKLMQEMVDCVNQGRKCDSADDNGGNDDNGDGGGNDNGGDDNGGNAGGGAGNGDNGGAGEQPGNKPTPTPETPPGGNDNGNGDNGNGSGGDPGNGGNAGGGGDTGNENPEQPQEPSETPAGTPAEEPAGGANADNGNNGNAGAQPKVYASPSATQRAEGSSQGEETVPEPGISGVIDQTAGAAQPEAQGSTGGLADTGAGLWPGAMGALFVIAGFVLLRRFRRPI